MENIQNGLSKLNTPIGISESTGMNIYQSYTANSGLSYMVGVREMSDLLIVEQIAEGTACTFLCGINIYHKQNKELIKEITVERNTYYSREFVIGLVHRALLSMLVDVNTKEDTQIDIVCANEFIMDALDKCYFEKSRNAIINWAKVIGIIKE